MRQGDGEAESRRLVAVSCSTDFTDQSAFGYSNTRFILLISVLDTLRPSGVSRYMRRFSSPLGLSSSKSSTQPRWFLKVPAPSDHETRNFLVLGLFTLMLVVLSVWRFRKMLS